MRVAYHNRLARCRICTENGNAALYVESANLAAYAGKLVLVHDNEKRLVGYANAADGEEALGSDLILNGAFTTNLDNWTANVGSGNATVNAGRAQLTMGDLTYMNLFQEVAVSVGKVYQLTANVSYGTGSRSVLAVGYAANLACNAAVAANFNLYNGTLTAGNKTYYFCARAANVFVYLINDSSLGQTAFFDTVTLKEASNLGATGLLIESSPGGSRNWAVQETGFSHMEYLYHRYGVAIIDPVNLVEHLPGQGTIGSIG